MADNKECPTCGSTPMGSGCYHICPNSDSYYSPEQERYDDQFYGEDDMRERYAATAESSQYDSDPDDGPDYGYGEDRAIADSGETERERQEAIHIVGEPFRFDDDDDDNIPF